MGRLTPEQQKQLDDLQRLKDAEDDDELEVWVRNSDGHATRLTGPRAAAWLTRNGYDADDADDSAAGEPLDAKGAKRPAKKTAPAKKGAKPAEPDDEVEPETDAEPRRTVPRAFF